MPTPSRFTKVKIAIGYFLLLSILLLALWFIRKEIGNLSVLDTRQTLKADSLLLLLKEKDEHTLDMLRTLNEASDKLLSVDELEEIIARQDTVITQQRVQHRVVVKRDSVVASAPKKGFFKRVGEVFVPSKKDTAIVVNTTQEFTVDTLLHEINPVDSLHEKIRVATQEKRERNRTSIQRNTARIRKMNEELTDRMDSLIKGYEEEVLLYARQEADHQQYIRQRSTRIIGGIAIGAILLAAFFILLIWRDITRSNRYRKELEAARKRAEELLQAREKLMLTITHDFKAPLSSIIGYVELMTRLPLDNRMNFYLDNIQGSSSHLLKLVNDLLDFHRLDLNKAEINRVAFNPYQLLDEIHTRFRPLADAKHLTLYGDISSQLDGRFVSDPLRIQQVVNNLLSNAIKFTSAGSVTLRAVYEDAMLLITVADTGKGMAPEDTARIFREFTRLPGAQGEEGFGLGLSIVAKLVNLLEGTIEVESREGEGSLFKVRLPLYPVATLPTIAPTAPDSAVDTVALATAPLRILLIDDDKIQLNLTAAMLRHAGFTAVCCEQPEELTEYLRHESFDLLLTDVQMPAINGFDLLQLLRASHIDQAKTIPVIAVTARSEMKEEVFLQHGFVGCVHKPFTIASLLAVIESCALGLTSVELTAATTATATSSSRFAPLTAFSEGDKEAARSIMESFVTETTKNAEALNNALCAEDAETIVALAHKLLPLFKTIEASDAVLLLARLEAQRGKGISDDMKRDVSNVLDMIYAIIRQAQATYVLE